MVDCIVLSVIECNPYKEKFFIDVPFVYDIEDYEDFWKAFVRYYNNDIQDLKSEGNTLRLLTEKRDIPKSALNLYKRLDYDDVRIVIEINGVSYLTYAISLSERKE